MDEHENPDDLGRFLTLADTAEILNISAGQAYGLVRSGELRAIKIGRNGQWRIERVELEAFIQARYEESRRASLFQEFDFSAVPEYSFDPADRDQTRKKTT
ncbi:MAG: helix-turn-helix domain-containing protein [Burkholderiaceae bacterium]|nr:helix-turn-helix domain-containing protein [Microbacteriaceae bacterium]